MSRAPQSVRQPRRLKIGIGLLFGTLPLVATGLGLMCSHQIQFGDPIAHGNGMGIIGGMCVVLAVYLAPLGIVIACHRQGLETPIAHQILWLGCAAPFVALTFFSLESIALVELLTLPGLALLFSANVLFGFIPQLSESMPPLLWKLPVALFTGWYYATLLWGGTIWWRRRQRHRLAKVGSAPAESPSAK